MGKIPTTSERRPISLLTRSSGLVERSLVQCSAGKRVEGDQVLLGVLEQPADLRRDRLQALEDVADALAGLVAVFGVEHFPQRGGDQAALVAAAVGEHVSDEVHRAALPRAGSTRAIACLSPSC